MFYQKDNNVNIDIVTVIGKFERNNGYFHKIKVSQPLMATTTIDSCTAQERILPSFHGLPILSLSLSLSLSLINSARCCPVFFLGGTWEDARGEEGGVVWHGEGVSGDQKCGWACFKRPLTQSQPPQHPPQ